MSHRGGVSLKKSPLWRHKRSEAKSKLVRPLAADQTEYPLTEVPNPRPPARGGHALRQCRQSRGIRQKNSFGRLQRFGLALLRPSLDQISVWTLGASKSSSTCRQEPP